MITNYERKDRDLKIGELKDLRIKESGILGIKHPAIPKIQNSEIH